MDNIVNNGEYSDTASNKVIVEPPTENIGGVEGKFGFGGKLLFIYNFNIL